MPYAVVMASGGAGGAAALIGLYGVAAALTGVAILQAILIPVIELATQHRVSVPQWRFGLFTVALGLAVIGENLQALAPVAGNVALALAWLTTLVLAGWHIALTCLPRRRVETVDGSWFLAPAALLGDAAATAAAAGASLKWTVSLDIIVCLAGTVSYALVIGAAGFRLWRRGLAGSTLAPWWISAGCGGLAAAAIGLVADAVPNGNLHYAMGVLVITTWAVGTVLLIAVLIGCGWYARQRPRGPWAQVWTPVFSMAVYAAGTDRVAGLSELGAIKVLAIITVAATLALWVINTALSLRHRSGGPA